MKQNPMVSALLGLAVGDALGVPFEFSSRASMQANPAKDMIGYGTHQQPKGTWSDDSSLTFCLATSLLQGFDLEDMTQRFIQWKEEAYWSARGSVFDIGTTTTKALERLQTWLAAGEAAKLQTLLDQNYETENGNGSLMRILPLLAYIKGRPISEQYDLVKGVSALTHRHQRAAMACLIYLKLAEYLLLGKDKEEAYQATRIAIQQFWVDSGFPTAEQVHFQRLIQADIRTTAWEDLRSGGYVLEVLEASFWYLLKAESYEETVLGIINLGHDTDTAAAIVGGLAGLYYGQEGIPVYWLVSIAQMEAIIDLGEQLEARYF